MNPVRQLGARSAFGADPRLQGRMPGSALVDTIWDLIDGWVNPPAVPIDQPVSATGSWAEYFNHPILLNVDGYQQPYELQTRVYGGKIDNRVNIIGPAGRITLPFLEYYSLFHQGPVRARWNLLNQQWDIFAVEREALLGTADKLEALSPVAGPQRMLHVYANHVSYPLIHSAEGMHNDRYRMQTELAGNIEGRPSVIQHYRCGGGHMAGPLRVFLSMALLEGQWREQAFLLENEKFEPIQPAWDVQLGSMLVAKPDLSVWRLDGKLTLTPAERPPPRSLVVQFSPITDLGSWTNYSLYWTGAGGFVFWDEVRQQRVVGAFMTHGVGLGIVRKVLAGFDNQGRLYDLLDGRLFGDGSVVWFYNVQPPDGRPRFAQSAGLRIEFDQVVLADPGGNEAGVRYGLNLRRLPEPTPDPPPRPTPDPTPEPAPTVLLAFEAPTVSEAGYFSPALWTAPMRVEIVRTSAGTLLFRDAERPAAIGPRLDTYDIELKKTPYVLRGLAFYPSGKPEQASPSLDILAVRQGKRVRAIITIVSADSVIIRYPSEESADSGVGLAMMAVAGLAVVGMVTVGVKRKRDLR